MTTINLNNTASTKITRADAIRYALDNMTNPPAEVVEVLEKILNSFTKKATPTVSKVAEENKRLAVAMTEFVVNHFDPEDLEATNARSIANNVQGITTTQKVVAVARFADGVKTVKVKGRTFYIPADVEVTE